MSSTETVHLDQLVHPFDVHIITFRFLPQRGFRTVAIGIAAFHGVLLPGLPVLKLKNLVRGESLKMASQSAFNNQASHNHTFMPTPPSREVWLTREICGGTTHPNRWVMTTKMCIPNFADETAPYRSLKLRCEEFLDLVPR